MSPTKPANPVHNDDETVDTEDDSEESGEEDFFSRLSTAVSKASGQSNASMAMASAGPTKGRSTHHTGTPHGGGVKKKHNTGRFARLSPRTRLITIFVIFEMFILGIGLWVAKVLEDAAYVIEADSTKNTLMDVQAEYQIKVTRMTLGFKFMSTESLFQDYLEFPDPSKDAEINFRLAAEIQNRQIEFSTLLDNGLKIVASSNKPRVGEVFDPNGSVSALQNILDLGFTQITVGAVLSYAELKAESPPHWLERADASSPALFGLHPYDTGANSMIRYVVTAVFSATDPTKPVGYLLAGDILNGKMSIPGNTYLALWGSSSRLVTDGFIGVYMSDEMTRSGWNVCNHATMATIKALDSRSMSLDVDPVYRSLLDSALVADGEPVVSADRSNSFVFVAKKAPDFSVKVPGNQNDPAVVLVQATYSLRWSQAFKKSMQMLAIVFAIDIFAVYLASCIFLGPLERLGQRIRKGKALNMHTVERLKHRKTLIVPILCIPLVSFAFSAYMLMWSAAYVEDARVEASVKETSVAGVAYGYKVDQLRTGLAALSQNSAVLAITSGVNITADMLTEVSQMFDEEQDYRLIEYCLLVDRNMIVIYDPNGADLVGKKFDPRSVVSGAMSQGYPTATSAILTYAEFAKEKAPKYKSSIYPTTPPSKLHPYDNPTNDVLVQFEVLPIISTDSLGVQKSVGAVVGGQISNGFTYIPETANSVLDQEGYSAIYIVPSFNSDAGEKLHFQLVCSALRQNDTTIATDLEAEGILPLLMQIYADPNSIATATLKINGDKHMTTARCSPPDYTYSQEGRLFVKRKTGVKCTIIVVQSARGSETSYLADRVVNVNSVLLIAQAFKLIGLMYLLYKAFLPFRRIILGKRAQTGGFKGLLRRALRKNSGSQRKIEPKNTMPSLHPITETRPKTGSKKWGAQVAGAQDPAKSATKTAENTPPLTPNAALKTDLSPKSEVSARRELRSKSGLGVSFHEK